MVTLNVTVTGQGAIFKDSSPAISRMRQAIITEIIQEGESRLDETLRPRPAGVYLSVAQAGRGKASTGYFRRSVHARQSAVGGTIESNVVYGPWLEGVSSRNATTRFKGYASFRRTAQWLEKNRVKPIATKHVNAFMRKLR